MACFAGGIGTNVPPTLFDRWLRALTGSFGLAYGEWIAVDTVWRVGTERDASGENIPRRDLFISPRSRNLYRICYDPSEIADELHHNRATTASHRVGTPRRHSGRGPCRGNLPRRWATVRKFERPDNWAISGLPCRVAGNGGSRVACVNSRKSACRSFRFRRNDPSPGLCIRNASFQHCSNVGRRIVTSDAGRGAEHGLSQRTPRIHSVKWQPVSRRTLRGLRAHIYVVWPGEGVRGSQGEPRYDRAMPEGQLPRTVTSRSREPWQVVIVCLTSPRAFATNGGYQ
jgi:hypothetical protein